MNVTNKQRKDLHHIISTCRIYFGSIHELRDFVKKLRKIGFSIYESDLDKAELELNNINFILFNLIKNSNRIEFKYNLGRNKVTTNYHYNYLLEEIKSILSSRQLDDYEVY